MQSQPIATALPFNPNLHGLRAIAAMAVLLFHWGAAFSPFKSIRSVLVFPLFGTTWDLGMLLDYGHLGVPLFFVLSGYLLTTQLIARDLTRPTAFRFWLRRGMRVYPAFWFQLITLVVITRFIAPSPELGGISDFLRLAVLWVDLPQPMSAQLNGVWWTLPVEMSFYVALPFVVLLSNRIGWVATLVASLGVSIGWRLFMLARLDGENLFAHLSSFDALPGSIFIFCIGFAVAQLLVRRPTLSQRLRFSLLAASSLLFYALLYWHRANSAAYWTGHWMLAVWKPMIALLIGVVMLVLIEPPKGFGWLSSKPMVWLGDVSFGIYLWHYPLLQILYRLSENDWSSPASSLAALIIVLVGTLILAAFSFYFIEKPIMAKRWSPPAQSPQDASTAAPSE